VTSALAERRSGSRLFSDRELVAAGARTPRRESRSGGGGLTLEQLLDGVWEGLHADGAAECPVCRSRMTRSDAAGDCGGCGSHLT
jgi:hypothetical protein